MPRALLLPLVLAGVLAVPGEAAAQLPPPKPPPTFTIAVVTLRSIKLDQATPSVRLKYERAGTKPTEYRASVSSAFTGASWVSFTEGATTSSVEGSTTWITGFVTPPGSFGAGGGCGANQVKIRAFLQFRGRNQSLQIITSAIRGDSVCVPFG